MLPGWVESAGSLSPLQTLFPLSFFYGGMYWRFNRIPLLRTWLSICEAFVFCRTGGHLESACFMSPSQYSKIDFPSSTEKTKWITHNYQGQGEKGNWGRHKYLFASPGNWCNSVWICQLIFKCLNDLYGQTWVSNLPTVTLNHLCIHIYRFIHITY